MEYEEVIVDDIERHFDYFTGFVSPEFSTGNFCLKDKSTMMYLQNGKIHRNNAPARIGYEANIYERAHNLHKIVFTFYVNGRLHNENGSAIVHYCMRSNNRVDIREFYYLNGDEYSLTNWKKQLATKLYW